MPTVTKYPQTPIAGKISPRLFKSDNFAGYAFVGLWIIGFLLFTLVPMLTSLYYSFTDYDLLSKEKWVGLDNFITIFTKDANFLKSLRVTLVYVLTSVPLKLVFALIVALMFRKARRGAGLYRSVFYLPSIVGGSVGVAMMWRQIFGSDGAINSLLISMNLLDASETYNWTLYPSTAMLLLIVMAIWQFGSPMLIFLAGLKQIPSSYYEAAEVDGAGRLKQFLYITLPSLTPIIFFNFVMQIIGAFMTFTQALIITDGGPSNNTLLYSLYLYRRTFSYSEMGYGCALAWILLVIIIVLTAFVFKSSTYWVFYENKENQ